MDIYTKNQFNSKHINQTNLKLLGTVTFSKHFDEF